jgi:hypothetical protein
MSIDKKMDRLKRSRSSSSLQKEELDENEVEFYKSVLSDMIPWNDKNYDKKLDEMARACLRTEKDPEFIALCEEHDRMMEEKHDNQRT